MAMPRAGRRVMAAAISMAASSRTGSDLLASGGLGAALVCRVRFGPFLPKIVVVELGSDATS